LEAKKIKIKTLFICLVAVFCIEGARWVLAPEHLNAPMIALGAARLLETILILLVVLLWGNGLSSIGLAASKIFPGIVKGLTWSIGFGVLALLGFFILSISGHDPLSLIKPPLPKRANDILLFFLVGGIVAPIAEEIFFRGILYGFFRRWGVVVALVLSTALFVVPHLGSHGLPITQIVGGILFAIAYEVEGSLMTPILIHSLGNLAIFSLSLLS
jgi:membrane protease YdiL (CAAX protease family)